jgi:glycosylphosphatidylinositol deacylase
MPTVWASTDHLSIVWCKQVVLAIVRAIFDVVVYDNGSYKISNDKKLISNVFNYHLVNVRRFY